MPSPENKEILDLHWTEEDPDFNIASSGVRCQNLAEITARITQVKDIVKKIDFDNQPALTEIPDVLKECPLLEEINISHTNITKIPDFLFSLPNLRTLSCRCSELSEPPRGLAKAEKLENLHLRINKNWPFPDEIISLRKLKILTLDLYSDISLHNDLGVLANLEELSLSLKYKGGESPNLPSSFTEHPLFKKLSITALNDKKKHDLDNTAALLAACPAFESLSLSGLAIGGGYKKIASLSGLKQLELRHLQIDGNIFDSIGSLNKLEKLLIFGSEFRIKKLPDNFGNLKELRSFSFAGNIVCDLPPSVYSLENLSTLEIGSCGITSLSDDIGKLKNLEKIHLYDNLLGKLPDSIFSLPRLCVLDIEDNVLGAQELALIKNRLTALAKNGQKIEFSANGQNRRQMVKRLRAVTDIDKIENELYFKYGLGAINENPFAIKYVDKNKFKGTRYYAELCIAAVRKDSNTLEVIDHTALEKKYYFHICIEAARNPEIGNAFKLIKTDQFTDYEFTQICLEAALHNDNANFLYNIDSGQIIKRIGREYYERICWAAVLHYPPAISKMIDPTEELITLAEKRGFKK